MLTAEQLKPHLLHPDRHVRAAVAKYLDSGWCRDTDLLPKVLEACRRDGIGTNSLVLAYSMHFVPTEASFRDLLALLATTADSNGIGHLNRCIAHAPPDLLAVFDADLRANPNVDRDLLPKLERRREVAGWPPDRLWQELQDLAHRSRDAFAGQIDHNYADALLDALTPHDVPDADTISTMLAEKELEEGWLEIFLVDLAGLRQLADAVPALVEKFHIDTDYLLERTQVALARIGHPLAAQLIREAWPTADWNFKNYAHSVLGALKHPDCEDALLHLIGGEDDTDLRIALCADLCELFSERGMEVVLREIRSGSQSTWANLRHTLLPVLDVLGVEVPEAPLWRREREEQERRIERRLAQMEQESLEWERRRTSGAAPIDYGASSLPPLEAPLPYQHDAPRVGRNDPCPCGSGKKFKKCCGKK